MFDRKGWRLYDTTWLWGKLKKMANAGYEDHIWRAGVAVARRANSREAGPAHVLPSEQVAHRLDGLNPIVEIRLDMELHYSPSRADGVAPDVSRTLAVGMMA